MYKRKSYLKGLAQLEQEGAIQVLYGRNEARDPILAVVGQLQFEVSQFRLKSEYGVETILERLPYTCARWLQGPAEDVDSLLRLSAVRGMEDGAGRAIQMRFFDAWAARPPTLLKASSTVSFPVTGCLMTCSPFAFSTGSWIV